MKSRRERYLDLFVAEARGHLLAATRLVSDLDRTPAPEPKLREIFRHFHSLKGMAVSMDLGAMSRLAHDGETLLDALREGRVGVDALRRDVLGEVVDCLSRMVDRASRGLAVEDPFVATLAERLREAAETPVARPPDRPIRLSVALSLRPDRPLPAARVATVLGRLREAGTVLACDPAPAGIRDGGFDGSVRVLLETDLPAGRLARLLGRIDEVEAFAVLPAEGDGPREAEREAPRGVRVSAEELEVLEADALALARRAPPGIAVLARRIHRRVVSLGRASLEEIEGSLAVAAQRAATKLGKRVRIEIAPSRARLPRASLQALAEPLCHAVRNAVDHGIEAPEERRAGGKPEEGRITISAVGRGERFVLRIEDDGRGMDAVALKRAAVERGLASASEASRLDEEAALRLAALPGLTTREIEGPISGRGVGLDVLADAVSRLGGTFRIRSRVGAGTSLEIEIPAGGVRRGAARGGGGCGPSEGPPAPARRPSRPGTR